MNPLPNHNAVAAIRVSTTKQGTDGDSPDAQKEQIERFAANKGITIKKFFVFLESASKEQQPMQEAIDYCKNPANAIDLFVIKSIDRFTRGGSLSYDLLKSQLEQSNVQLVDIYGVISGTQVNTLDHLGFEYNWSIYSPSKKSEILEAERSKDELRDIMSRMIGAEIRYTQNGYWMRQPPIGYLSEKVETKHGKRTILKPHPVEAEHIIRIFELRAEGLLTDKQIAKKVNDLGFRTRARYIRDKNDRTRIIKQMGDAKLTEKNLQKIICNTIYAGVNVEKWTNYKPVKCEFDGLVSIDLFNRANRGKKYIARDSEGDLTIERHKKAVVQSNRIGTAPRFAYRRFVLCPECSSPLLGSASRGKTGKYYPAYHCSNRGHYFRVTQKDMDERIAAFVSRVTLNQPQIDTLISTIREEYARREQLSGSDAAKIDNRIKSLQGEIQVTACKIKMLNSSTAIAYIEAEIQGLEQQIKQLEKEKRQMADKKPVDMQSILERVRYFLEHLDQLLLKQGDPVRKAQLFGALFNELPTYDDLDSGNQKTPLFTGVNMLFRLATMDKSLMVNLTTSQVETLFGELEYIEVRLKVLGVV
jgi:site-specific DNA recombinase